jgi:hypothetical protein
MIKQPARFAAVSTDQTSTPGKYISSGTDDFAGVVQFAHGGADDPPANGHSIDNADYSVGNHAVAGVLLTIEGTIDDSAKAASDVHSIDQPHLIISSAADFADVPGTSQGLTVETQSTSFEDSLNNGHLSGIFDHIDNLTDGFANSTVGGGFSTLSGHSFDSPQTDPIGLPEVFSDAKAIGGHHGGGGGGTTPAAYTTNSGTGVDIHVTYDSSVGNAPTGFTSVVQNVANFFASSFQDPTQHITINIDVGYGEVDGMRMGTGALGESVTNLQGVTDSQLTSAYSASYLNDVTLGSSPTTGNLYVSFAEAKALNITVPNTIDGYVGFSSQSGIFDYNNTDGVSSGQYDFNGVVAHEFSEVMGRILLVGGTINNAHSYMAYDLFHYSGAGVQDFSGNGGYFSTNSGSTNLASFNNPSNGGDAGDWASSGTSGSVYDAFNAFGTSGHVAPVTNIDLWALHAVGFDLAHPITV